MNRLEEKIIQLKGDYIKLMEMIKGEIDNEELSILNNRFMDITKYDIKIHEEVLGRELDSVERRYIIGNRMYERYLQLYSCVYNNCYIEVPTNAEEVRSFAIDWYRIHNLWITK